MTGWQRLKIVLTMIYWSGAAAVTSGVYIAAKTPKELKLKQ